MLLLFGSFGFFFKINLMLSLDVVGCCGCGSWCGKATIDVCSCCRYYCWCASRLLRAPLSMYVLCCNELTDWLFAHGYCAILGGACRIKEYTSTPTTSAASTCWLLIATGNWQRSPTNARHQNTTARIPSTLLPIYHSVCSFRLAWNLAS